MLALLEPPRARKQKPSRPALPVGREILRISEAGRTVGDVLIDGLERVLRRDPRVPRDVALKALVLYTRRHVLIGEVVSRADGRTYAWDVIDEDEATSVVQTEHFSPLE